MPNLVAVNTHRILPLGLAPLALVALLGLARPASLASQDHQDAKPPDRRQADPPDSHPSHGKIDDVERSADHATAKGKDHDHHDGHADSDDDGFGRHLFLHLLFYTPRDTGQGYLSYPYATSGPATFVVPNVYQGRSFLTLQAGYFRDVESSLRAWHVSVEWAGGMLQREIEYTGYAEPMPDGTDHLHLVRLGFAQIRGIGNVGYTLAGLGVQGVILDHDDREAVGPQLELGVQLFPKRPFGVGGTVRLAPLTWNGGPLFGTGFIDAMGHVSVFTECGEIMLGYRWTRIGTGAPFTGVSLGVKLWLGPDRTLQPAQQRPADEPQPILPR